MSRGLCLGVLVVLAAACSGGSDEAPAADRLSAQGISVRLPPGWHGRIRERGFPLPGAAIVYAATFPLPAGEPARRLIGSGDVLVVLAEGLPESTLPVQERDLPLDTRGISLGRRSVVEQYFVANGRAFVLDATFGAKRPPTRSIRRVNALLAGLSVERRAQPLKPAPDPAPASALAPPRLLPTPVRIRNQCRLAQDRSPVPILCPARLPRPFIGWPQRDRVPEPFAQRLPGPGAAWSSRSDPRYRKRQEGGVSIGYGAPWEPDSGPDWRLHLWRNRPCCFLHFEVFRRADGRQHVPAGARRATLGGRRGLLKDATSYGYSGKDYLYWPNHTRFLWREHGVEYVATLHRFGTLAETRALLDRLLRELRPVRAYSS